MFQLKNILKKGLLPPRVKEEFEVLSEVLEVWKELIGTSLFPKTKVIGVKRDTLFVGVSDYYTYQLLLKLSPNIIRALQKRLGRNKVKRIIFKMRPQLAFSEVNKPLFKRVKASDKEIKRCLESIGTLKDEELRRLFFNLVSTYFEVNDEGSSKTS